MSNNSSLEIFTTEDTTKYAYTYTPAEGSNSTFLFLHGYPSSHEDWIPQIEALTAAGFGAIAPDMLGFGASDMPVETEAYTGRRLSDHLIELLDHKNLETVIGVGHDWGSVVLSRLAVYHQDRLEKIAWVDIGYQAPGGFIDIDAINAMGMSEYGYMQFGYWYFFTRYDGGSVIRNHLESFWNLVFPANDTVWVNNFAPVGSARAWLNANTLTEDASFMPGNYKSNWMSWMSRENATEAGLNCYRSQLNGVNDADDAQLTTDDWLLHVPVLAIGASRDPIGRSDMMLESTRPWAVAGFDYEILDGGHWLSLERSDEVSKLLLGFASK